MPRAPQQSEPWNPFYVLLLAVSGLFVLTALASAMLLFADRHFVDAGSMSAEFQEALRKHGYLWLLWEAAAMAVLGLLSMGLDRRRQKERSAISNQQSADQQSAVSGQQSADQANDSGA